MLCLALAACLQDSPKPGRYELAQHLARFERAWEAQPSEARRRAAVAEFGEAVTGFFGGASSAACMRMDAATRALTGEAPSALGAVTLRAVPPVAEPGQTVRWEARWSYLPPQDGPITVEVDGTPASWMPGVPQGGSFVAGEKARTIAVRSGATEHRLSVPSVPGIVATMERAAAMEHPELRGAAELWKGKDALESQPDWPALAARARRLLDEPDAAPRGEARLAIVGKTRLRAWIPDGVVETLVVAFHGAGGSENLFFEGYGLGRCLSLAKRRGWAFVAPRSGPDGLEAALAHFESAVGAKPRKVVLMGHSAGTAAVFRSMKGAAPAAIVLFAPVSARWPEGSDSVPAFLAVGRQEMAMLAGSAARLRASRPGVEYLEPDPCEHYLVVREAADAAFRFLDRAIGS